MSTALSRVDPTPATLSPRSFSEAQHFAETVARSTFIPEAYRGKPGDVLACILAGDELGIGPMQALRAIHVVKGKPILSADLMIALVKKNASVCEYFRLVETTSERCTYETRRRGDPEPTRLTWTMEDARRADLTRNPTWKNHPAPMLRARCGSALARAVYPDLVMGIYDETEAVEIGGDALEPVRVEAVPLPPSETLRTGEGASGPDGAEIARQVYGGPEANPPATVSGEVLDVIDELGRSLYGNEWERRRSGSARWASGGETAFLRDLTASEGERLTAELERRIRADRPAVSDDTPVFSDPAFAETFDTSDADGVAGGLFEDSRPKHQDPA